MITIIIQTEFYLAMFIRTRIKNGSDKKKNARIEANDASVNDSVIRVGNHI